MFVYIALARLYLCRHGQTENNRLHLVQGARVDPPLNSNGHEQARRIGMAVTRLLENTGGNDAITGVPSLVAHSKMLRAKETAQILTSTVDSSFSSSNPSTSAPLKVYGEVPSLGEVDFGTLEGKDAKKVKSAMRKTFAAWSLGKIDTRPPGGEGESGREVLERAAAAIGILGEIAVDSSAASPSIMAVSHSTYLRVLLSMAEDAPLLQSALWKVQNGSINIVDVNVEGKTRAVSMTSGMFGGGVLGGSPMTMKKERLDLVIPEVHLIRRNEVRHLEGMNV